jgi:hypothetical protein
MDWIKLVVLLVFAVVWILSHLAKQQKDAGRVPRPVPPPRPRPVSRDPNDPAAAAAPTKPEDDNKYREEMDRKREKKPIAAELPRPRPRRYQAGLKPPPLPPMLPPAARTSLSRRAERERPSETVAEQYVAVPVLVAEPLPVVKVAEPPAKLARPASPAIKGMLELLKKPASLSTVFLLREVLDLPLSKRPRRRK